MKLKEFVDKQQCTPCAHFLPLVNNNNNNNNNNNRFTINMEIWIKILFITQLITQKSNKNQK